MEPKLLRQLPCEEQNVSELHALQRQEPRTHSWQHIWCMSGPLMSSERLPVFYKGSAQISVAVQSLVIIYNCW